MDFWISRGFLDFMVDFWISCGFLDFTVDFWISNWISLIVYEISGVAGPSRWTERMNERMNRFHETLGVLHIVELAPYSYGLQKELCS